MRTGLRQSGRALARRWIGKGGEAPLLGVSEDGYIGT